MVDGGVPCAETVRECREIISSATRPESGWVTKMIPFSQAFGPLLAFATVVFGWRWVSRDNNKRETRKEVRGHVDDIVVLIRALEASAVSYFQSAVDSDEARRLSIAIKRDLQHLAGRFAALKPRHKALNFDRLLADFRWSITGGDFDAKARGTRSANDPFFATILNSGQCLIDAMETTFAVKFCKH